METSDNTTWSAWGDHRPELSRQGRAFLRSRLGDLTPGAAVPLSDVTPPPSALPGAARERLAAAVGADWMRVDDASRARHSGGQSYTDLIRRRAGDVTVSPDAVVLPADHDEVLAVLRVCAEEQVAVVPFGGGTSVVGGVEALRGGCVAVVALDLSRLDAVVEVDPLSLLATFGAGLLTPAAEAALNARGLTLGHFPQSFERASVGGYVVTRSAGQASTGYGRIDDLVAGVRMATPEGELSLPAQPASAAGPDLRRLVLGSEGTLGVVTEVTLRVHRVPAEKVYEGWMVPTWAAGLDVFRRLAQDGPRPDVARLSDEEETQVGLTLTGPSGVQRRALEGYLRLRRVRGGCLVVLGFEGAPDDVAWRRRQVRAVLRDAGAVSLGQRAGRSWEHGRFSGPYLRDTLLDTGVLVETLETAATWSRLPLLYSGVRRALRESLRDGDRAPLVGCHVSHIYATGASLYFTVLSRARTGEETVQWTVAKEAANDAIVAAGGTITHHHAVGLAHRDHLAAEDGGLGLDALRAVKDRLDPAGILNPGKLLPPRG
jgi:alkyldihydroxyacetonephosphate synthase